MRFVDSHCHLSDGRIFPDSEQILQRARDLGVGAFFNCGTKEADWPAVASLSEQHGDVVPFFGLHPFFVCDRKDDWEQTLSWYVSRIPCGVGEIGLDGTLPKEGRDLQEAVFLAQLRLARRFARPVAIHCRKAWGRMLSILRAEGGLPHGGVFHAWSGAKEMVREVEALGGYVSFAGSITRENNKKGITSCQAVSRDRILVETDAPDMLPAGCPPPHNLPENLPRIFSSVARIRNADAMELERQIRKNSRAFIASIPGAEGIF